MAKNDGLAEVRVTPDYNNWQVIINHFEGEPEVWDEFQIKEEAQEEVFKWNNGFWGDGFTFSAEELRLRALE